MPPRRNPHMAQQQEGQEPTMGELIRELQRIHHRLDAIEEQQRVATPPIGQRHGEEENPFHQEVSSDEEPIPNRFGVTYQRRTQTPHQHDFGVKIDLPEFDGRMDPDEFIDWLQSVERIFEYKEIPQERRVNLIAIRLKKSASLWWENLKRARLREGRAKIVTWEKMKRELQRKYLPAHYRQDLFLRLQHLQQRDLSVEAYTTEFEQLALKCDLTEPEEHTVARYLGGLRPAISNIVQLQPYWTLMDVQSLALKVEKQLRATRPFPPSKQTPHTGVNPRSTPPPSARPGVADFKIPEMKKFEKGSTSATPPARRCFKCHGFGHLAANCPTRNLVTFTEHGEAVEHLEVTEETEEEEEYQLQADEGELLVVRRALQAASKKD